MKQYRIDIEDVRRLADKYIDEQNQRLGDLFPEKKRAKEEANKREVEKAYRSLFEPTPPKKRAKKVAKKEGPWVTPRSIIEIRDMISAGWNVVEIDGEPMDAKGYIVPFDEHDKAKRKTKRRAAKAQLTETT
jgi:hypothetical protein